MFLPYQIARRLCVMCAVAVGLLWGGSGALAAQAPTAEQSFNSPGTVISVQPMALNSTLSAVAFGQRIAYMSTDPSGAKIIVSAAILQPKILTGVGKGKTVAWGHGTSGSADQCAPSKYPNLYPYADYQEYANLTAALLRHSYTVVATDYPGLGTPGAHPYLIGNSAARAVIDSVRAARFLNPTLSTKWLAVGHSQGGHAALFAGEITSTYGSGLNLLGAVAIAPGSGLDQLALIGAGTPANGFLVLGIYGLATQDPTVHPEQLLAQPALDRIGILTTGCYREIISTFADLTADQLLSGGALPAAIVAKFTANNPGQQRIPAPLLLVQGTADSIVPVSFTENVTSQTCSRGTVAELREYIGATHDTIMPVATNDIVSFANARVLTQPPVSTCS